MMHPEKGTQQDKLTITGNYCCQKDSRNYNTWHYEITCTCGRRYFISRVNWLHGVSSCIHCRKKKEKNEFCSTRIYKIWAGMLFRCRNERAKTYRFYGARGIKVCASWHDPQVFNTWAINNGYTNEMSIDRINPDGDYEPSNCRWIPKVLNVRRKNKIITYPHSESFESANSAAKFFDCHSQHIRLLCRTSSQYKDRWFYYA